MNPKRPLIFVPGIRTSRLAIRKENGSLEHFWPLMPHEFLIRAKLDRVFRYLEANIRLKADDDDDNVKVVATSLIPFAYDGLIKSILTWGYKPNFDFWIFPYDWRQSNRISGHLLAKFIEEKTEGKCYDGDGVDIISHSMGGIIAQAASLNGAPIRRVAYIACPHLGSPLAYFILHPQIDSRRFIGSAYHDYPSSTYWQPNNDTGNNNNNIERRKSLYHRRKELFVKFPSMYELLPDESYLRNRAILLTDGKPESGAEDTYLKNECAFKEKDMRSGVIKAMEFKKELGEELPQRQDVLLICGTNQMTCDTIHYRTSYQASITERRPSYLMQQGFSLPYDSGQGGDGYVPVTSAMALISGKPAYSNSVFIPEAHTVLSNSKATIEAIGRFLAA
ncbi:MAG: lipase/acyltransferase domain-containing protein [Nitrososphaera sp.]